jgi:hypothetical protein
MTRPKRETDALLGESKSRWAKSPREPISVSQRDKSDSCGTLKAEH